MPKRIIAATLLLTFAVASCRTWAPMETVPNPMPKEVRIELLSGEQVVVMESRFVADTLVGRIAGGERSVRIPTDQIAGLEIPKASDGKTILLVVGIGLVALLAAAAASWDLDIGSKLPPPDLPTDRSGWPGGV